MQVFKVTGKKPKALEELPEPPESLLYIWEWWKQIVTGERITFLELQAWSQLTGANLLPYEVDLIRRLDAIFWRHRGN